jgi:hypothetical protein
MSEQADHLTTVPEVEIAQAFHVGVCRVSQYMRDSGQSMLIGILEPTIQEQCVHALFLRAASWMTTLEKLTGPVDFQAIAGCARGLLEGTVDVIILCKAPKGERDQLSQKMLDWTMSAKFKMCSEVVGFYGKQGRKVPDEHQPMVDFYEEQKPLIDKLRASQGWKKHPERWTGRNLLDDCAVADGLAGQMIGSEMELSLCEFYHTQIRRLNWQIHSSGLAGVWNISKEVIIASCAAAFKWSTDLAMLTTMIALRNVGYAVSDDVTSYWEKLKAGRFAALRAALRIIESKKNA